jgi:hypothetical protein
MHGVPPQRLDAWSRCNREHVNATSLGLLGDRGRIWEEIQVTVKIDHLTPYFACNAASSCSPGPTASRSLSASLMWGELNAVPIQASRPQPQLPQQPTRPRARLAANAGALFPYPPGSEEGGTRQAARAAKSSQIDQHDCSGWTRVTISRGWSLDRAEVTRVRCEVAVGLSIGLASRRLKRGGPSPGRGGIAGLPTKGH